MRGTQFDLNNIGVGDRIVVEQVSTHPGAEWLLSYRAAVCEVDENMSEEITLTRIITTYEQRLNPVEERRAIGRCEALLYRETDKRRRDQQQLIIYYGNESAQEYDTDVPVTLTPLS